MSKKPFRGHSGKSVWENTNFRRGVYYSDEPVIEGSARALPNFDISKTGGVLTVRDPFYSAAFKTDSEPHGLDKDTILFKSIQDSSSQFVITIGQKKPDPGSIKLGQNMEIKSENPPTDPDDNTIYVIDGDTIAWRDYRFRLLGIDAPEMDTANGSVAQQHLKNLLSDVNVQEIHAVYDQRSDSEIDAYDRHLVWIYTKDNNDVLVNTSIALLSDSGSHVKLFGAYNEDLTELHFPKYQANALDAEFDFEYQVTSIIDSAEHELHDENTTVHYHDAYPEVAAIYSKPLQTTLEGYKGYHEEGKVKIPSIPLQTSIGLINSSQLHDDLEIPYGKPLKIELNNILHTKGKYQTVYKPWTRLKDLDAIVFLGTVSTGGEEVYKGLISIKYYIPLDDNHPQFDKAEFRIETYNKNVFNVKFEELNNRYNLNLLDPDIPYRRDFIGEEASDHNYHTYLIPSIGILNENNQFVSQMDMGKDYTIRPYFVLPVIDQATGYHGYALKWEIYKDEQVLKNKVIFFFHSKEEFPPKGVEDVIYVDMSDDGQYYEWIGNTYISVDGSNPIASTGWMPMFDMHGNYIPDEYHNYEAFRYTPTLQMSPITRVSKYVMPDEQRAVASTESTSYIDPNDTVLYKRKASIILNQNEGDILKVKFMNRYPGNFEDKTSEDKEHVWENIPEYGFGAYFWPNRIVEVCGTLTLAIAEDFINSQMDPNDYEVNREHVVDDIDPEDDFGAYCGGYYVFRVAIGETTETITHVSKLNFYDSNGNLLGSKNLEDLYSGDFEQVSANPDSAWNEFAYEANFEVDVSEYGGALHEVEIVTHVTGGTSNGQISQLITQRIPNELVEVGTNATDVLEELSVEIQDFNKIQTQSEFFQNASQNLRGNVYIRVFLSKFTNEDGKIKESTLELDRLARVQAITTQIREKEELEVQYQHGQNLHNCTGITSYQGQLILYGSPNAPNVLYMSDEGGNITYFPFRRALDQFLDDITHVEPIKQGLIVFTTADIYLVYPVIDEDEQVHYMADVVYSKLTIQPHNRNTVRSVGKDILFMADNAVLMLRPNPYVDDVTNMFLENISHGIKNIIQDPMEYIKERLHYYEDFTDLAEISPTIEYFIVIKNEEIWVHMSIDLPGTDPFMIIAIQVREQRPFYWKLYDTRACSFPYFSQVFDPVEGHHILMRNHLTIDGGVTMVLHEALNLDDFAEDYGKVFDIQTLEIDDGQFIYNSVMKPDLENYQEDEDYQKIKHPIRCAIDTGYMDASAHLNKRFHRFYIELHNLDSLKIPVFIEFNIDGSPRQTSTVIQLIENENNVTEFQKELQSVQDISQALLNLWELDFALLESLKKFKMNVGISGRGRLPQMIVGFKTTGKFKFFRYGIIFKEQSAH